MDGVWSGQEELRVTDYDTHQFPFRSWFESVLGVSNLEMIHTRSGVNTSDYRTRVKEFQKLCDDKVDSIQPLIDAFLMNVVTNYYGPIASRQPNPTFRGHFSVISRDLDEEARDFDNDQASFLKKHYFDNYRPGIFHRDKDYGLLHGTVNLWLPVTSVYGANSLWVGSRNEEGRDAKPVSLEYGQCLFFDGASRWHGAVWNTSPSTRISFDLRFLPERHLGIVSAFARTKAVAD